MNLKPIWDKFTDEYSFLLIHPQFHIKKYTNEAIELAEKYSQGILVDIGCGRMPYRKQILPHVKRYIGIDHPKTAKLYRGKRKPDIFADATDIPLEKDSCDTVLLLQVLEHLPEPEKALMEVARIIKPKGILILSTIQAYPLHDEPYDFYRFTKFGLKYLLEKNNFKIISHIERGNVFILCLQSFNIYLMLFLKRLAQKKALKLLALLLAIPVFVLTTFSNLIATLLAPFDRNSKFKIIQIVVAARKQSD